MENLKREMQSILRLKELLKGEKDALVGLEHLIYIKDEPDLSFVCSLCSKKGDGFNILSHIKSSAHKNKFLRTHFPSVYESIQKRGFTNDKTAIHNDVCDSIEKQFGRLMPRITSKLDMSINKDLILNAIKTGKHFTEDLSQTFLRRLKDKISQTSTEKRVDQLEDGKISVSPYKRSRKDEIIQETSTKEHSKSSKRLKSRSRSRKKSNTNRRMSRSPMKTEAPPKKLRKLSESGDRKKQERTAGENPSTSQSKTSSRLPAVIQEYSLKCSSQLKRIERKYESYKINPHTHPRQTEEWNAFWLQQFYSLNGNPDPDVYDKWKVFWPRRIAEIHDEDILVMRVSLRRKLDLPIESSDLIAYEEVLQNRKVKLTERKPLFTVDRKWQGTAFKARAKPGKYLIDLNELSSEISKKISANIQSPHMSSTVLWPEIPKIPDMVTTSRADQSPQTRISTQEKMQETVSSTSIISERNENRAEKSGLLSLSNNEISMLFENFANLSQECQSDLIDYMHQVEKKDPELFKELTKMTVSCDGDKIEVVGVQEVQDKQSLLANESDDDDANLLKTVLENVSTTKNASTIGISSQSSLEDKVADTDPREIHETLSGVDILTQKVSKEQQLSIGTSGEGKSMEDPCTIEILDVTIIKEGRTIDSDYCQMDNSDELKQQESLKVTESSEENEQLGIEMSEEMVVEDDGTADCDTNQEKPTIEKVQEQQELEDFSAVVGIHNADLMIAATDAPSTDEALDQSVIEDDEVVELAQVESNQTINDYEDGKQDGKQNIQNPQTLQNSSDFIRIADNLMAEENPPILESCGESFRETIFTIEISDESSVEDDETEKQPTCMKSNEGEVSNTETNQQQTQKYENPSNVIKTDSMMPAIGTQSTSVIIELSDESSSEDCETENPDRRRQTPKVQSLKVIEIADDSGNSLASTTQKFIVQEIIDLTL